jgi:hypothetical protein
MYDRYEKHHEKSFDSLKPEH